MVFASIYCYNEKFANLLFLAAYDDKNTSDLTHDQKKQIAEAIRQFNQELEAAS